MSSKYVFKAIYFFENKIIQIVISHAQVLTGTYASTFVNLKILFLNNNVKQICSKLRILKNIIFFIRAYVACVVDCGDMLLRNHITRRPIR